MSSPAVSFQTGRQLALYRAGPRREPDAIPLAVEDLEARARARLTPEAFDWISGAAGAGRTAHANLAAFDRWRIVPRMLRDVSQRDFGVELFGRRWPLPFGLAPIGVQAGCHPDGEKASARAAAALGLVFILSTVSSFPLEEVARAAGPGPRWFQLYWPNSPELTASFLRRARAAGYEAIVVTLDTPTLGWRETNLQLAHLPFLRGDGLANYFHDPVFRALLARPPEEDLAAAVAKYLEVFSNLAHTWESLRFIREQTPLPLLVKGIQHPDDARRALAAGVDGVIVSNHGGRQTDGSVATLDALPGIVAAVAGRVPVLLDGGVRRGCDAFKALALGASAVLLGRPCLWALAVGGEPGVREFLANFGADLDLTFALAGKSRATGGRADDLVAADRVAVPPLPTPAGFPAGPSAPPTAPSSAPAHR